jgi:outer membrane protein assembly factor BamB
VKTRTGAIAAGLVALAAAGCGGQARSTAPASNPAHAGNPARATAARAHPRRALPRFSPLRLPPTRSSILPGYLLVADRNNDRVLLLSPDKRVVWQVGGLHEPDDAFFTPGYRSVITNEEFDDTLVEVSLKHRAVVWRYGHAGSAGSAAGYLDSPDDAYRTRAGITTVADIRNCRIVQLKPDGSVLRILGGSCVHDPPRGLASPNGDTPLPDGGLLVTEIGGWIDRLDRAGQLVWSVRSPVSYPSDAQLLPDGNILVCGFTTPGRVVEMTRAGAVVWSFGASSGPDRLDRPSLAIRLPNGLIAVNDDWRHRVILVDPHSRRIVWQYGRTDVASAAPGYLDKPDGMDFLPATAPPATAPRPAVSKAPQVSKAPRVTVARVGRLPFVLSRAAVVSLPPGRIAVLGGLVAGQSSSAVLAGPPSRLRHVADLPAPTHDAAAAVVAGHVELVGGGTDTSVPDVTRIDPSGWAVRRLHALDEPLSDLGAATVSGHLYLVGGYTGSRFASAVLRVVRGDRTVVAARLPVGLRYAGVAALGGSIYVAGGITSTGTSVAVYRVDVRRGRVERIGSLPEPVAHAPLVSARGALWLIGGDGSRDIVRIDPRTGSAQRVARLPQILANAAATVVGGRIVVVGGDGSSSVWSIVPPAS